MSSSSTPTSGSNPNSTAVAQIQQPGIIAGPQRSLPGVPAALIATILQFNPNSAPVLRLVSRLLRQNTEDFLRWNINGITAWSSSSNSTLANILNRNFAHISTRFGSQPDRIRIQFHLSLPSIIRSLALTPVNCPNGRILLASEILQCNSTIENVNLKKAWRGIREAIVIANPQLGSVPALDAPAREIRSWMQNETNQPALQRITQLDFSDYNRFHLSCIPQEIGLCAGLQQLDLCSNQLVSLQEGVFLRMTALQWLNLSHDRLTSLSERGFEGLVSLQWLNLSCNRIDSLPEGVFRGLTALRELYITTNRLAPLPERVFEGLTALRELDLTATLPSLPEGLFRDLGNLQQLRLAYNHLTSLPEGVFQRLTALQQLSLGNNQLGALPERVFQGLTNLQELELCGNPQSLIFFKDLERDRWSWRTNNLGALGTMREFFNYTCISPLAALYQLTAGDRPLDAVQEAFSRLPPTIKESLYGKVWEEAGGPHTDDPNWGEHHTFEDMPRFQRALKKHVTESFARLSPNQKNGVYGHVYHLAQRQGVDVDPNVHNWGEVHAFDNILRLIDAMGLLQGQSI
jgi:Leucine-rich repeat (LRR) protein